VRSKHGFVTKVSFKLFNNDENSFPEKARDNYKREDSGLQKQLLLDVAFETGPHDMKKLRAHSTKIITSMYLFL